MNVFHYTVEVKGETDMKIGAAYELSNRLLIKLLVIVVNEDCFIVQLLGWGKIMVCPSVIKLLKIFADALVLFALLKV